MRSGVFRSRTLQSVTIRCKRLRIIPITRGLRQAQPGIFFSPTLFFFIIIILLFYYFLLRKNKHAHRREFILAEKLKREEINIYYYYSPGFDSYGCAMI